MRIVTGDERTFQWESAGGLVVVRMDAPGEKVNTWTGAALADLARLIAELEKRGKDVEGVLFLSGKPDSFHVGANLRTVLETGLRGHSVDGPGLGGLVATVHSLFSRLAALGVPTLAAVNGPCLGGGLELALAMTARIASDNPRTVFGLPECSLGLIPGGGGTQRLPRLIGCPAVDLILRGRVVPAGTALALGLIDGLVAEKDLAAKARDFLLEIISGKGVLQRAEPDFSNLDSRLAEAHRQVVEAARGRELPAPGLALKAMREGLRRTLAEGLEIERECFLEAAATPEAEGSINTFFLKSYQDKALADVPPGFSPKPVKKAAVLGFGTMGRGIAIDILRRMSIPVVVKDIPEALQAGTEFVRNTLDGILKREGRADVDSLVDLIKPVSEWTHDFNDVDLVIEAVFEDPDVKAEVYRELCVVVPRECLIASNTSGIPISRLAENVSGPERFAGLHFFSPVWQMELLEVIRGEKTGAHTISSLLHFCGAIRKRPLLCNDHPGFVVNAMLSPYLLKTFELLESGVTIEGIDEAMVLFGFPLGPVKLMDEVGIDVVHAALTKSLGLRPPVILENLVRAGRFGRKKSGRGFYLKDGRVDPEVLPLIPVPGQPGDYSRHGIQDMLYHPFVQVGRELLAKGVVDDHRSIDMGAIWGIGFPPDKGGPLKWADLTGLSQKLYGQSFYPAAPGE